MDITQLLASAALSLASLSSELPQNDCSGMRSCLWDASVLPEPLHGTWTFKLDQVTRNGSCLPQINIILEPMIKSHLVDRTIYWADHFHPGEMQLDSGSRKIVWQETQPGSFVSELQVTRSSIVNAKYSVRPLDQLNISLTVEYFLQDSPPEYGMKDCVVTVEYTASHAKRYLSSDEH